jgi:prepilin-type N-terminal cleavage/methylation domain-containing protein
MKTSQSAGFTLVEALLVVVIAGIVMAAGFPLAQRAVVRSNVRGARSHAISLYTLARAAAQETGRTTTLSFTGNVGLITASPRLVAAAGSTVDTIRGTPANFASTYRVAVTGSSGTSITIDSRGLMTSAGTTLRFTRDGITDSLVASGFGRIAR